MKKKHDIPGYLFLLFTFTLLSCGIPYSDWSGLLSGSYPSKEKGPTLATQLGYSKDDIIVIVHADDIGIHKDQTDGALDSMKMGMVRTGSVMVPCPDFDRVASIWKETPELGLGLHLTLTSGHRANYRWKPVLSKSKVPGLYDPDGYTWLNTKALVKNWNIHEALMELEAQIINSTFGIHNAVK